MNSDFDPRYEQSNVFTMLLVSYKQISYIYFEPLIYNFKWWFPCLRKTSLRKTNFSWLVSDCGVLIFKKVDGINETDQW